MRLHTDRRGQLPILVVTVLLFLLSTLSACTPQATPTPTPKSTPLPPVGLLPTAGASVHAAGKVVPAEHADLSFPVTGRVQSVNVQIGDRVATGDQLAALQSTAAEAAVVQAQTDLFQAQAKLAELEAGPRQQQIDAAQAALDGAKAHLAQLNEPARPEAVNAAKAELAAAQAALAALSNGPTENDRIEALAALSNAKAALQQAQSAYNRVASSNDVGMLPESRQLQEATNNYEAAQARYNALYGAPGADAVATAQARVQQAQAALDAVQNPGSPAQVAEAEAQVRSAQAALDLLKAGPTSQSLGEAAVTVTAAEAALKSAQAAANDLVLRAPFTGTVTSITLHAGEMVQPGQVALTLADLDRLQVETTDLSERDVPRVAVGQPATVRVPALNTDIAGRVVRIAPQSNIVGGDVLYAVLLDLPAPPLGLRWGMSVNVEISGK